MSQSKYNGKLYVLEGIDNVGKTTLATELVISLSTRAKRAHYAAFPGYIDGTLGKLVYDIHHAPNKCGLQTLTASSLQALHLAAHLEMIEREILPRLADGTDIVLDRYWWSMMAYGTVAGVSTTLLEHLRAAEEVCWGQCVPAALFIIRRARDMTDVDLKLSEAYSDLIDRQQDVHPIHIINNDQTLNTVLETVQALLSLH
jgi:dTMP kinase